MEKMIVSKDKNPSSHHLLLILTGVFQKPLTLLSLI